MAGLETVINAWQLSVSSDRTEDNQTAARGDSEDVAATDTGSVKGSTTYTPAGTTLLNLSAEDTQGSF